MDCDKTVTKKRTKGQSIPDVTEQSNLDRLPVKRGRPPGLLKSIALEFNASYLEGLRPKERNKFVKEMERADRTMRRAIQKIRESQERATPYREEYLDLLAQIQDAVTKEMAYYNEPAVFDLAVDHPSKAPWLKKPMDAGLVSKLGKRVEEVRHEMDRALAPTALVCAFKGCDQLAQRKYCAKHGAAARKRRERARRRTA